MNFNFHRIWRQKFHASHGEWWGGGPFWGQIRFWRPTPTWAGLWRPTLVVWWLRTEWHKYPRMHDQLSSHQMTTKSLQGWLGSRGASPYHLKPRKTAVSFCNFVLSSSILTAEPAPWGGVLLSFHPFAPKLILRRVFNGIVFWLMGNFWGGPRHSFGIPRNHRRVLCISVSYGLMSVVQNVTTGAYERWRTNIGFRERTTVKTALSDEVLLNSKVMFYANFLAHLTSLHVISSLFSHYL